MLSKYLINVIKYNDKNSNHVFTYIYYDIFLSQFAESDIFPY